MYQDLKLINILNTADLKLSRPEHLSFTGITDLQIFWLKYMDQMQKKDVFVKC